MVKASLVLLLMSYLLRRVFLDNDVAVLFADFQAQVVDGRLGFFLLALVLMPANWLLEARKLSVMQADRKRMDMRTSFRSVLCGVTLGVVTPARLGEYAGRLLVVEKESRSEIVTATFVMSMLQMLVTVLLGGLATMSLVESLPLLSEMLGMAQEYLYVVIAGLLLALMAGFYFFPMLMKQPLMAGFRKMSIRPFSFSVLLHTGFLSWLRYAVYVTQYVLVLMFFGVDMGVWMLYLHIAVIYLLQTLIPFPPIASLVSRGGVAVLILTTLGLNEFVVLTASLSLWVINLMIPAFCGLMIILKIKSTPVS